MDKYRRNPDSDYAVGYKRPPAHSRFKPGQSGNPRGRQRGIRNFKTDLLEVLRSVVKVSRNGSTTSKSLQRVALLKLAERALSADLRALALLLSYAHAHNNVEIPTSGKLSEEDDAIIENFRARELASVLSDREITTLAAEARGKKARSRNASRRYRLKSDSGAASGNGEI